jgi:YVTN family beta-propeller protein
VELPSGTVTFLFTDIEGSTRLVRELRGGYADVAAAHRRLLRVAFEKYEGHEIDTQGDAFFVAFRRANDAVAAAACAQQALAEHQWPDGRDVRVRMGLHTGEPTVGDEGYHGLGVHRAARICAAGHGGQVLLSGITRDLVEDDLPEGLSLLDLGEHRLKDLERPERIHQLVYPGVPPEFPALKTLEAQPAEVPFADREDELVAAVAARFGWRRWRRRVAVSAAAVAAGVGAAALGLILTRGSSATASDVPANAVGVFAGGNAKHVANISVGSSPTAIAAGADDVWAANTDDNTVSRINQQTEAVVQTIDVGSAPSAIAVGGAFVWVANSLDGTVSQIDPQKTGGSVLQTTNVGNAPSDIAYGLKGVWVVNSADKTLTRIDPASGKAGKPIPTGAGADGVAVGEDAVWVTSSATGSVTRVDPKSGEPLQPINVGQGPAAVAVGAGAVWVVNALDGTVSKVDPKRASVVTTIPVGKEPRGIAVGDGAVWVSDESGTLTEIKPDDGSIVRTLKIGNRPQGIAVGPAGIYLAVRTSGAAHRGGMLRIAQAEPLDSIDPAVAYYAESWQVLSLTNDGLVGFRRVGGTAGGQLVPDLAESLPAPTADGKTYSFRLREGIRYSTGKLVRAEDFRRAIERSFAVPNATGPNFFRGIVGAAACKTEKCDLSQGIVTDDAAGTVTFHLAAPDPDFLYKLAVPPSFALPSSTPRKASRHGLPATGPYLIVRATPKRLELARNPRFHEWSPARPDGYSDRIVMEIGTTPDVQLRSVERGNADWAVDARGASSDRLRALDTQHASQVHRSPTRSTAYLFLNTRLAPFDSVQVRRALNYAADREAIAPGLGRPTCQVLPPGFLGYSQYCPYHVAGGRAEGLARARRLVAASGKRGGAVAVWTPDLAPLHTQAIYWASVLRSLGFRATVHTVHGGFNPYSAALSAPTSKPQAGLYAWNADYPAPAGFVTDQLTCGAPANLARFCDRAIDAEIRRAGSLQTSEPQAANALWSRIDRQITDLAPWVSTLNLDNVDFVSKRVGNYQYNPEWGLLLDQLWVR